jgi:uncharacterized protein (DUF983 family)
MPDFFRTPLERIEEKPGAMLVQRPGTTTGNPALPTSGWGAMLRGLRNRCPRCGQAKLFLRFLKPHRHCPDCRQDWSHQCADDFPAYVSIFMTGHVMAPLIIGLSSDTELSVTAMMAVVMPTALALVVSLLQPAKGGIIALQWWFGIHGFMKERIATAPEGVET